jgi:hypothetical protein
MAFVPYHHSHVPQEVRDVYSLLLTCEKKEPAIFCLSGANVSGRTLSSQEIVQETKERAERVVNDFLEKRPQYQAIRADLVLYLVSLDSMTRRERQQSLVTLAEILWRTKA